MIPPNHDTTPIPSTFRLPSNMRFFAPSEERLGFVRFFKAIFKSDAKSVGRTLIRIVEYIM